MAACICSGVASSVAGFGECGGDGYFGGWVGGEETGTEKWGAEVCVDWKRMTTGDQHRDTTP